MSTVLFSALLTAFSIGSPDASAPLAWQQRSSAPSPRSAFSSVHVSAHNSVLVFAGETQTKGDKKDKTKVAPAPRDLLDDLWEYEVANDRWRSIETTGPTPGARAHHAATFDAKGNAMWVFGGRDRSSSPKDDLWRLDVERLTWKRIEPSGDWPPARFGASLHFDPRRNRLVLHGGCKASLQSENAFSEVWTYEIDKNAWTKRASGPARWQAAAALCPELDSLMVQGGLDAHFKPQADTWIYRLDRDLWADAGQGFQATYAHAAVWDPATKLVLFDGGASAAERALERVWSFDPLKKTWKELALSGAGPGPRAHHAALLVQGGNLWVFGGTENRSDDAMRGAEAWIAKVHP